MSPKPKTACMQQRPASPEPKTNTVNSAKRTAETDSKIAAQREAFTRVLNDLTESEAVLVEAAKALAALRIGCWARVSGSAPRPRDRRQNVAD